MVISVFFKFIKWLYIRFFGSKGTKRIRIQEKQILNEKMFMISIQIQSTAKRNKTFIKNRVAELRGSALIDR